MTYRTVSVEGQPRTEVVPQPAPQLMWVEIADLVIDDRYQRPLARSNWDAIKRIASRFQWSRFSPVLTAPVEGGKYALIDGQHRAHAAALCGFEKVPAMVAMVAPSEQALAFIEINTQQIKVRSHAVYRAALTAGEAWAIQSRDAVAAAGCDLMTRGNVLKNDKLPGQVYTIDLIRGMVEAGHGAAVTDGLAALLEYDAASTANFSDALLRPWLYAAAETGASRQVLMDALRAKRPWLMIEVADRIAEADRKPKAICRREAFIALIRQQGAWAAA